MITESPMLKADDGNYVQFYYASGKNEHASVQAGRPIFDKVLMARVLSPGGVAGQASSIPEFEVERILPDGSKKARNCVVDREQMTYRQRWARQLEAWEKNSISSDMSGTAIEQWSLIDIHQVAELKSSGIHTVEMLRDVPDSKLAMGWRGLREQARNWLEHAAGAAPLARVTAENAQMRDEIADLRRQMTELAALTRATAPTAPPAEKARPPKAAA